MLVREMPIVKEEMTRAAPDYESVSHEPTLGPLHEALDSLRSGLGFESASVFVLVANGRLWCLAGRAGPVAGWHSVLDADFISGVDGDAFYPNAWAMPAVGPQLAELGCGSVYVVDADDDVRILLDSAQPKAGRVIRFDRTLVADVARRTRAFMGESDPAASRELAFVDQVAESTSRLLSTPWPSVEELLCAVGDSLHARWMFLITQDHDGTVSVFSAAEQRRSDLAPENARSISDAIADLDTPDIERLAELLEIPDANIRTAPCGQVGRHELLLACWEGAPTISEAGLRAIARIVGTFRISTNVRRGLVDAQVARERTRWIQDIHDGVTQATTAAIIQLENLRSSIETDPTRAVRAIDGVQEDIRSCLADLREIMTGLKRPLDGRPPSRSLEALIEDVVQRWRLPARTTVRGNVDGLPQPMVATALVVVREALTNAAKHSSAKIVHVRVNARPDGLRIEVKDTGRGFDSTAAYESRGSGLGLRLMRQQIQEIGGTIDVTSAPGAGTVVTAFLPSANRRGSHNTEAN